MKYKIWNKTDNLITPIGEILTPLQVINKYPMAGIEGFKFIICDAPISMGVFMEYTQTRYNYRKPIVERAITSDMTPEQIDLLYAEFDSKTEQEFLDALTFFEENPPIPEATAEERIASALEYQNMMLI